jgi:hypothetical protein
MPDYLGGSTTGMTGMTRPVVVPVVPVVLTFKRSGITTRRETK